MTGKYPLLFAESIVDEVNQTFSESIKTDKTGGWTQDGHTSTRKPRPAFGWPSFLGPPTTATSRIALRLTRFPFPTLGQDEIGFEKGCFINE
jgi:hypothetical protein